MTAYLPINTEQFDFRSRRRYPLSRSDFRPAAYVVLTRESGVTPEGCNG
jgi:hypothetical protein